MAGKAEQAERIRDLTKQIAGVGVQEMPEIQFQMISPGREPVTIYAAEDGRPVAVPAYMLGQVMTKTLDNGDFMFVADPKDAPEYKIGDIKCFLHVDAPERVIVEEIGLGAVQCRKHTLPSQHAWRMHGQHRHKQEWAAYQEFIEDRKEEKREQRSDEQLEATLSIARGGAAVAVKGECDVEDCDYTGTKRQLAGHKMGAHKEG